MLQLRLLVNQRVSFADNLQRPADNDFTDILYLVTYRSFCATSNVWSQVFINIHPILVDQLNSTNFKNIDELMIVLS